MEVIRVEKNMLPKLNKYMKDNGSKFEIRTILNLGSIKNIFVSEVK